MASKLFEEHIWCEDRECYGAFELSAIAIDPSKGRDQKRGDYAAIAFAGLKGGKIYLDVWQEREPVSVIVDTAISMYFERNADAIGLEANAWQDLIAPEFDRRCEEMQVPPMPVELIHNHIKKETRIGRLGPYLMRSQLRFTKRSSLTVRQLEEFPQADHDDGPDAAEMAIRLLNQLAMAEQTEGDEGEIYEHIGAD